MRISILKNILILSLSLLSIHLSGRLWFEDISGRNFFYFFAAGNSNRIITAQVREEARQTLFFRTIVGFGNDTFHVNYRRNSAESNLMNSIVHTALHEGIHVNSQPIDWLALLSGRTLIYEYRVAIPADTIVAMYYDGNNQSFVNRVNYTNMIIAVPSSRTSGTVQVYFINTSDNMSHQYTFSSQALTSSIDNLIDEMRATEQSLFYISSAQNGFNIFGSNLFIPQWINNDYSYNTISFSNPFGQNPSIESIEPIINRFFENPTLRTIPYPRIYIDEHGVSHVKEYIFSSDTTVIKLYPNLVLEYSNFQRSSRVHLSFADAYAHAMRFLARDETLVNDIFLVRYEVADSGYTFFFDYIVNNFPILLPASFRANTGLSHAIQLTVQNNIVTSYRRFMASFNVNTDTYLNASVSFWEAIDTTLDAHFSPECDTSDALIKNMILGYRLVDREGSMMRLAWQVEIDNTLYMKIAQ